MSLSTPNTDDSVDHGGGDAVVSTVKYTSKSCFHCREGTLEFVEGVGLSSLVDLIVCGDDQVKKLERIFLLKKYTFYF